jgi:flagellar protein FlaI
MNDEEFQNLEMHVFRSLAEKLGKISDVEEREKYIEAMAKGFDASATHEDLKKIVADSEEFSPITEYLDDQDIEDIMVNNTSNIFVYSSTKGDIKVPERIRSRKDLDMLVSKLKMYATTSSANNRILDVHLPRGSRANIVDSPLGENITIRNFRRTALSVIDLVNSGEMSYQLAGRLWLYTDGLGIRPANFLIGGMPASGKTTMLNAMFSFFRPEQRIVVIEETYELNTETQENCVRLETNTDMGLEDLVKNALRMRPDLLIIGEVRGAEAKDMMTAMNIGKITMGTIHASTTRDVITRLENTPMNIPPDIISLIDAIIVVSQVSNGGKRYRRVTQVSEISGIETQVLLSDLYTYNYKTHEGSEILPSVTYRDTLSKLSGYPPLEVIEEENRRAKILEKLNGSGIRTIKEINEFSREYYDNPGKALGKLGLGKMGTLY